VLQTASGENLLVARSQSAQVLRQLKVKTLA